MNRVRPAECEINEESAWALIRAAGDAEFKPGAAALTISAENNETAIDVAAGGAWKSAHSVSPSAARILDIYLPYAASGTAPPYWPRSAKVWTVTSLP